MIQKHSNYQLIITQRFTLPTGQLNVSLIENSTQVFKIIYLLETQAGIRTMTVVHLLNETMKNQDHHPRK